MKTRSARQMCSSTRTRCSTCFDSIELLDERAATILRLRFGLGGGEPMTLKEIGGVLGLTRERVRQIEVGDPRQRWRRTRRCAPSEVQPAPRGLTAPGCRRHSAASLVASDTPHPRSFFRDPRRVDLASFIRPVPDFPKPGILFRDITPPWRSPGRWSRRCAWRRRGGTNRDRRDRGGRGAWIPVRDPIAIELGVGVIPVRKPGKLPGRDDRARIRSRVRPRSSLEMHTGILKPGAPVSSSLTTFSLPAARPRPACG
jgi:hypothetical protein